MRQGPPTVGDVLTQKLAELDIRPTELARRAGVNASMIGGLMSGYRSVDGKVDRLLAEQLGMDAGYLRKVQDDRLAWERGRKDPQPDRAEVELRKVLVEVAGGDDKRVDIVMRRITEAVEYYRATAYPVRHRDSETPVATTVSDMRKNARKFLDVIQSSNPNADQGRRSILTWYQRLGLAKPVFLRQFGLPGGMLLDDLPRARKAAQATLDELMVVPHREANWELRLLAGTVARALADDLGVRPTSSRHTHIAVTCERGGAAYSRVLEKVMLAAGRASTDLEKWIAAGLGLFDDLDKIRSKRSKKN